MVRLTSLNGNASEPQWSPDGRIIAFLEQRANSTELWIVNKDGSGLKEITNSSVTVGTFDWSPKTDLLAYDAMQGGRWGITFFWAGSQSITVPEFHCPPGYGCYYPSFSYDGRSIVFVANSSAGQSLSVANTANGTIRQALPVTPNVNITSPKFSMDDKNIFFLEGSNITLGSEQTASGWKILSVPAFATSGSFARTLLSAPPGGAIAPDWQPLLTQDCSFGQRPGHLTEILLSGDSVSGVSDLFLVEENTTVIQWAGAFWTSTPGTTVNRLTNLTYASISGLAWSPDGNTIVYSASTKGSGESHIYVISYVETSETSVYQR
jgi:Tol biopolymer transport system component